MTKSSLVDGMKRLVKASRPSVINHYDLKRLRQHCSQADNDLAILMELPDSEPPKLLEAFRKSKSQFRQDLFALSELKFKRNGFFVEFGATNGVDLSNTHFLEKEYGWTGILAEPARRWHEALKQNRSCAIETNCVWKESGAELTFNEVDWGELSTIDAYSSGDGHRRARSKGRKYQVQTISLNDLLEKHAAPKVIDFLSIDTEGSEFEILNAFDFGKHQFRTITCEHNEAPQREPIYKLLTSKGYERKYQHLSGGDDWYVKPDIL